MPRHAHHEPAPPACYCCGDCEVGYAPAPCYYPAAVPAPCYYPAAVPAPAPPSSSASDHLLHAIVAQLLLGSSAAAAAPAAVPAPPPQAQQPPPPPAAHHTANNPYPHPHHYQYLQHEAKHQAYAHQPPPQQQQQHQPQPGAADHGHLLLHSLLRRVAALESTLPRCFPPPPPPRRTPHPNPRPRRLARQELVDDDDDDEEQEESPPSPPPRRRAPPRPTRAGPFSSARERAARTIQAHFRRFLARRSRTLRQLKELAVLRSKSAALRGSLSGRRGCTDPAAVSEGAMGLLFRLDAIQGGDPMIREGKRAVSRELTRILEFVDKVLVKEHEQLTPGDALDNGYYHEGCSAEFMSSRPAVNKKKVSFSSNGRIHEHNGETDKVKEVDAASESSSSAESDEVKGVPGKRNANGKPGLATPTSVPFESRRVAGDRR